MNILVTGASAGIGKCIANSLEGEIFAVGRCKERLQQYKNYLVCDFENTPDELGEYIISNKIDVVINNAGEYMYKEADMLELADIERLIRVNLTIPMYIISKALPYMKTQKWGRIVNIGSISGVMGEAGASVYSASKSGLIGMTKAIALETAQYNVTINTINPGWVETNLGLESIENSEFSHEEILDCIPQKRFVTPQEVAGMVKYLISDDAKGVTGQSINLCAGLSVGC